MGKRDYCDECQQQPCMGGGGPGSCIGGKSKTGGERGKKAPLPKATPDHMHDYRLVRITTDVMRDGKREYSVKTKEFRCYNRQGKCNAPVHMDVSRMRLK